ncbi:unnamed protein product [Microthlaspi erraticum]|uniref:Uncharacterized protein n=1 Tax=Microthlaspi erraticum TaxID=1685480 RepID=A0A6D2KLT9_9BRAS|nr:unnamed protein product [Microthlaspi erraticum]CAA7054258.1 unnamed protein product [Microthlaspi erraticum]
MLFQDVVTVNEFVKKSQKSVYLERFAAIPATLEELQEKKVVNKLVITAESFLALLLNVEMQALFIKLQKNGIYIPKERYAQEEVEKKASKDKKSLDVCANLFIGNQALHWKPICMQDYTEAATVVFLFCVADGSFAKAKPFS